MKKILLILLFTHSSFILFCQNLDRIAISSGGMSYDNFNITIGQTFVFNIFSG